MNYTAEMGCSAMIYIPNTIKIGSSIQKLVGGDTHTHRQQGDLKGKYAKETKY
jgi:hypothetical protein